MTKTIEELQAQRIKELEEDRNGLCARITELENKLEVATDECVWFANKNHQLHADKDELEVTNKSLVKSIDAANAFIDDLVERNKTLERRLESSQSPERLFKLLKRYNPNL